LQTLLQVSLLPVMGVHGVIHIQAVGITVTAYTDRAEAVMDEGSRTQPGRFVKATLRPQVTITQAQHVEQAKALHHEAHRLCFIANSLNFEVECECEITVE